VNDEWKLTLVTETPILHVVGLVPTGVLPPEVRPATLVGRYHNSGERGALGITGTVAVFQPS